MQPLVAEGSFQPQFQDPIDTGHVAMLERPDEFNALLAEFLAE